MHIEIAKCDNVKIMVGNFQDVESSLTEKYDYITLIGVFEYSQGYIGTAQPYVEMLRRIARHLALGGRIVIAIENRLGLKYWAAAPKIMWENILKDWRTIRIPEVCGLFPERNCLILLTRLVNLRPLSIIHIRITNFQ